LAGNRSVKQCIFYKISFVHLPFLSQNIKGEGSQPLYHSISQRQKFLSIQIYLHMYIVYNTKCIEKMHIFSMHLTMFITAIHGTQKLFNYNVHSRINIECLQNGILNSDSILLSPRHSFAHDFVPTFGTALKIRELFDNIVVALTST